MARILLLYSTVDGHTLEICKRLEKIIVQEGHQVALQELAEGTDVDLEAYDRTVIGASVRYGKHRPAVARFINQNVDKLEASSSAFFSVNAVARKPEKRDAQTNPYVKKFFRGITWKPSLVAIFGGEISYPKYRFWDKTMIRLIMWMTKGPTDPNSTFDFTNWDEVEAFGRSIGDI